VSRYSLDSLIVGEKMTELIGRIISTDVQKRQIVIVDKNQILHPYKVPESLDIILQKQRPGWYVKVTSQEDLVKRIDFAQKPADWPQGGKAYQKPRNERLIVIQSCAKLGADVFAITTTPDTMDFDTAMDLIIDRAIKDADWIMKAGEQK
jgi:hypothetical protein